MALNARTLTFQRVPTVLSSTEDQRSVALRSSITFMQSVSLPWMKLTIFLAAYRACSGGSVTGKALRMVLIHWTKAFNALNSALPLPSRMTHPSGMKVSPRPASPPRDQAAARRGRAPARSRPLDHHLRSRLLNRSRPHPLERSLQGVVLSLSGSRRLSP